MVKYFLLPYQLIAEFAWDWLSVHYWTSLFVIVHAMLLSMLECCSLWRLCTTARIRCACLLLCVMNYRAIEYLVSTANLCVSYNLDRA